MIVKFAWSARLCVAQKKTTQKESQMFKKITIGLTALGLMAMQAQAALVATDVDFTGAGSDLELVFKAILGVAVILFGFKKVRQLLKA